MQATINHHHSLKYYNGLHQKMRDLKKSGRRPIEFGNKLWPTSLVLIDYLKSKPLKFEGLRVLEVGCGWGLLGIYLAKEFSCQVTCTDFDEAVLPIVQAQAELNNVRVITKKASFTDFTVDELKSYDLIIGAEVCYSEETAKQLNQLLKKSLQAQVKYFLIADPGRPDFEACVAACKKLTDVKDVKLTGTVNGKVTHLLFAKNE